MDEHVLNRIERLEQSDKELLAHLQKLAIQTERVATSTEILSKAMTKQYEQNEKMSDLGQRITALEGSSDLMKKIGGIILTVGIGIIMVYLFKARGAM